MTEFPGAVLQGSGERVHEAWTASGAGIVAPPESKPWMLHEFTIADLHGKLFRVFYDLADG